MKSIIPVPAVTADAVDGEPSVAELDAIEREMPLIVAEVELLDVRINLLDRPVSELDARRLRRARRKVLAARRALANHAAGVTLPGGRRMNATERNLTAAHAEVKAEIARTDTKIGLLLAFVGAVLAGTWTVAKDVPLTAPACAAGGAGMALLVGAAGLLLRSVRPNLRGRHGFPLWATLSPEEIRAALSEDLSADIAGLSRIAVAKFTGLRRAVDLTCAGGALLILAAALTVGGAL